MTNDYKDKLLEYLTGKCQEQEALTKIGIEDSGTDSNGLDTYLTTELGVYSITDILQSDSYDNYILYGLYRSNGLNYGYMLLVDKNYNPIQLITQFDSGTDLQEFYKLALDEKNQIYGIDYNNDTNKYRFIMLNNDFANRKQIII